VWEGNIVRETSIAIKRIEEGETKLNNWAIWRSFVVETK
jgi:hypothetical protein